MSLLSYILWSVDPDIFVIPWIDHPVRWYGFLFAMGFILGQQVMFYVFRKDGRDEREVETLTIYMVVAVVAGARLGHCLFYDPLYYLSNLHKILYVWEGGLASHGGAIGMLIAIYLFTRKIPGMTYFWALDRLAIVTCLTGALIRTGNFTNSEMIGTPTESFTGVVFVENIKTGLMYTYPQIEDIYFQRNQTTNVAGDGTMPVTAIIEFKPETSASLDINRIKNAFQRDSYYSDYVDSNHDVTFNNYQSDEVSYGELNFIGVVRHPAQLYEAFYCVVLFLLLFHIWYWHRHKLNEGFAFGLFLTLLWSLRFLDEFVKLNQEPWEEGLPLNMGQMLSIPMIIIGITVMIRVGMWKKIEE